MNSNLERTLKNLALPVYELTVDETDELAVHQISLVDSPAISDNYILFNSESPILKFKSDNTDKKIVYGAAMIPNLPIYRTPDKSNPEGYYVYYSPLTVEMIAHKFMMNDKLTAFNLNHSDEKNNAGCKLVESFVTKSRYKELGFDLPVGSWVIGVKVLDSEIWDNYIKTGELKGFSVEILAEYKPVEFKKEEVNKVELIKKILIDSGYLTEK